METMILEKQAACGVESVDANSPSLVRLFIVPHHDFNNPTTNSQQTTSHRHIWKRGGICEVMHVPRQSHHIFIYTPTHKTNLLNPSSPPPSPLPFPPAPAPDEHPFAASSSGPLVLVD